MAGEFGYLETKSLERCEVWVGETTHWEHVPYVFRVVRMSEKNVAAWRFLHEEHQRQESSLTPLVLFGVGGLMASAVGVALLGFLFPSLLSALLSLPYVGWIAKWVLVAFVLAACVALTRVDTLSRRYKEEYNQKAKILFTMCGVVCDFPPNYPHNPTGYVLLYENGDRIT